MLFCRVSFCAINSGNSSNSFCSLKESLAAHVLVLQFGRFGLQDGNFRLRCRQRVKRRCGGLCGSVGLSKRSLCRGLVERLCGVWGWV